MAASSHASSGAASSGAASSGASSAGGMVTVMNRYPHALHLAVYDPALVQARKGAMDMTAPQPQSRFTLRGAVQDPHYHRKDNVLLGMAGQTQVPAAFWEAWLAQNRTSPLVTGQIVFAEATENRARARKAELARERTGLEGLEPDALPVAGVKKDDGTPGDRR